MPITTLHLSSQNSKDLGNGKHELDLIPGLEFPHEANPLCYLHTLAFSNTLKNVSRTLYDNATLSLGAGALASGGVRLNIPAGDATRLYMGFCDANQVFVAPLHKDAAFVGGATGAYTSTHMKATLADLEGMTVEGSSGLLAYMNTLIDETFRDGAWVDGVASLGTGHGYPALNIKNVWSTTATPTVVANSKVYFDGLSWGSWKASKATSAANHGVVGDTYYEIRGATDLINASNCASAGFRLLTTAEIKKAITASRDAGGVPGATSGTSTANVMSVAELLGIQVGLNGNGSDGAAAPGSGSFTGEFDGTKITSNEGASGSFTFPYDEVINNGFIKRPQYPTRPADSKGQQAAGKSAGPDYTNSIPKWPAATSGRGSLIVVTPNDHKFTTNPMGASIFPNSDQTRGGVAVSDYPATFGWTQESKSFTVTLDGSYDIEHVEREIAMRFKLDDPDKDGLFASLPDVADPETESDYAAAATIDELLDGNPDKKKVRLVTLEPDDSINRVRIYTHPGIEVLPGSTLMTGFLGFGADQTGALQGKHATGPARVDRARAVAFHCPSIVSGVYSSSGLLGGSQLALVPIEAEIGRPQVYTASVPIKLRARTAGSTLQRVIFFLSSEDGDPIDLQEERFDATVVIEW